MPNRVENAKPAAAEKNSSREAPAAAAAPAPEPVAEGGGIKPFIPLIANLIVMPVLAYAMTAFVLVPKLAKKVGHSEAAPEPAASAHAAESSHGSKPETAETGGGKGKYSVPLSKKTLVNASCTMGTRYLLAEFILVGNSAGFKAQVEKADAELRDAAASA